MQSGLYNVVLVCILYLQGLTHVEMSMRGVLLQSSSYLGEDYFSISMNATLSRIAPSIRLQARTTSQDHPKIDISGALLKYKPATLWWTARSRCFEPISPRWAEVELRVQSGHVDKQDLKFPSPGCWRLLCMPSMEVCLLCTSVFVASSLPHCLIGPP